jgi:hypothetical protein
LNGVEPHELSAGPIVDRNYHRISIYFPWARHRESDEMVVDCMFVLALPISARQPSLTAHVEWAPHGALQFAAGSCPSEAAI